MNDLLNKSQEAANTEDELIDSSFDLDSSIKSDTSHQMEEFNEEWVAQLSRDDKFSFYIIILLLQWEKEIQKHQNWWD